MNTSRTCVLYARKSTDREDQQILSIPSQLRALREFAERSGLTIEQELTESFSARRPGRPVFSKLLKDAESGRVERILAWRLDRLARNPIDGGTLIFLLGEGCLKELVTPEGSYSGAGDSKFMLSVLFGAATKMTDDLSDGVKRGNSDLLKEGRIPGRPPLGYTKVRDKPGFRGAGKVVPDPLRFPIVQRAWKELATGTTTVAEVWRRAVGEWGLRTRPTRYSQERVPPVTTFYQIFSNPFYAGLIRHDNQVYTGEHVPMVTRAEYDRVQKLVRPEGTTRPSRHRFLYRGLLHCGSCSRLLVGERIEKRSGLVFTYYRCGRRRQGYERCLERAPREQAVTEYLDRDLQRLAVPKHVANWTLEALDWYVAQQKGGAVELVNALQQELANYEGQLHGLTDYLLRGVLNEPEFVARRDELRTTTAELRAKIASPEHDLVEWRGNISRALEAGLEITEVLRFSEDERRRSLVGQLYEDLRVADRITKPSLRFPFTLLEHVEPLRTALGDRYEDELPPPSTVLSQSKNAHRRTTSERALSAWCTKLLEVRTSVASRDAA